MTELEKETQGARPDSGRVFFKRHIPALPGLKAQLIFWLPAASGLALDLWTKKAVFDRLGPNSSISIINGFLRLVMVENAGAAFGIAQGKTEYLVAASVIALIGVLVFFLFSGTEQKLVPVALGLFAAGVCGNLWDRIFNDGRVRDFIDVTIWPGRHWPAFNIADAMLCIGIGLLLISTLTAKSCQKPAQQHK